MLTHSWLYPGAGGPITFFWTRMLIGESCSTFCNPMDYSLARLLCPWDSPGKNTGVGSHYHLQGIFLIQGLNPGLLHHRQILYHLIHWKLHKQYGTRKPYTGCRIFFCLNSQKLGGGFLTGQGKTSSISIPQTRSIHLEMRGLYLIHIKVLNSAKATCLKCNIHPQGTLWTSRAFTQMQVPSFLPPGRLCHPPSAGKEGRGWDQGCGLFSLKHGGSKDPLQSPLDPEFSHFLISHLRSPPLPILGIQV